MPPVVRYSKNQIIEVAYRIVETEGIENLNARKLSQELNCSIQPIFHNFKTMDELKKNLLKKIYETYQMYMISNTNNLNTYRQMSKNYIRFAKEKPKLFQLLFMTPTNLTPDNFVKFDISFKEIEKIAEKSTKLSKENVKKFYVKMSIFTHGIASLVASKSCNFTDEQIDKLLVDEYQALMKLEEK